MLRWSDGNHFWFWDNLMVIISDVAITNCIILLMLSAVCAFASVVVCLSTTFCLLVSLFPPACGFRWVCMCMCLACARFLQSFTKPETLLTVDGIFERNKHVLILVNPSSLTYILCAGLAVKVRPLSPRFKLIYLFVFLTRTYCWQDIKMCSFGEGEPHDALIHLERKKKFLETCQKCRKLLWNTTLQTRFIFFPRYLSLLFSPFFF